MNLAQGNVISQYGMDGKLYYQQNARTGQQRRIDHVYLGSSLIAQRESALTGNRNVVTKFQHTDALGCNKTRRFGSVQEFLPWLKVVGLTYRYNEEEGPADIFIDGKSPKFGLGVLQRAPSSFSCEGH